MRLTIAGVILLSAVAPVCAADCSVQHYNFMFGSDTDTTMTVKSGAICSSTITAGTSITSATIAQPASNGTASITDSHRWGYRSRPGFRGKDAFVVAISGISNGRKFGRQFAGESKINVSVDVTP